MDQADEAQTRPALGLVCITVSDEVRYRTVTRTRYLQLPPDERREKLRDLYRSNTLTLLRALDYCAARGIRLYRVTSDLYPMSDLEDGTGREVLQELAPELARVGPRARELGVRVVIHPDQFVVLSSESETVRRNSVGILAGHARNLDMMGLPRNTWTAMNVHGGKGGRSRALIDCIATLPEGIRSRLTLENDERAYGAAEILEVCREAGVPMVFDAHHHVVREKLPSLDDPSVEGFTALARETWTPPEWQLVHVSNGRDGIGDHRHHDLVTQVPRAFERVQWIEVEAKAKEVAIEALMENWPVMRAAQGAGHGT
ncbi:MAG TPA: UV DNA damage repair endonuclease UvsE [Deinococcales bacterium]|nr:UV DNA damage repair endonuclease UvsE [Deinococcales bacterium]